MLKKLLALGIILVFVSFVYAQEEQITITTYYPSPYGSYRELRAQRIAIGDNYFGSSYCWPPDACTNQIDTNADLVVEGNVGIGTATPRYKLSLGATGDTIGFYSDAEHYGYWIPYNNNGHMVFKNRWASDLADIRFQPDNNLIIENGNVGIGTTNAVSALTFGKDRDTLISTDTPDGADTKSILLTAGGGGGGERGAQVAVYGNEYAGHEGLILLQAGSNPARGEIALSTAGGNYPIKLVVKYNGNVGIGTMVPDKPLEIVSNQYYNGQFRIKNTVLPNDESSIGFIGNGRFWVIGSGASSTGNSTTFGIGYGQGNPNAVAAGNRFTIIGSSGNVGIGTANPTAGFKLDVIGRIRCESLTQYSSREYKQDIETLAPSDYQDILKKLEQTEIFRFRYKEAKEDSKLRLGLIAEEAPEEIVSQEGKGIDLGEAISFLMAAVKAQTEEIKGLKQEISRLKK